MKNEAFVRKLLLLAAQFDVACDSALYIVDQSFSRDADLPRQVGCDPYHELYTIVREIGHRPNFGASVIFDIVVASAKQVSSDGKRVAQAIWKTIWRHDIDLNVSVSSLLPVISDVEPSSIMCNLCLVNLAGMTYIARCFYLWSLNDLLKELSETDQVIVKEHVINLIKKWDYGTTFDEVPIHFTEELRPITGQLGMRGGQSALNTLIGEYAARPPTRVEVIERLTNLT